MQHDFHCDDKHERRSTHYYYLVTISGSFDAIADGAIKLTVGLEWNWINPLFDWTKYRNNILKIKIPKYKLVKQVYIFGHE